MSELNEEGRSMLGHAPATTAYVPDSRYGQPARVWVPEEWEPEPLPKQRDWAAWAKQSFEKETGEHELIVLHDEGVYRHLRLKAPGTMMYHFDLVTWPGHLAVSGDMGDYVFARVQDMFEFFRLNPDGGRSGISPDYWSQKLVAGEAKQFSKETFVRRVRQQAEESYEGDPDGLHELLYALEDLYLEGITSASEAYRTLEAFEGPDGYRFEPYDLDTQEFTHQFLWICHAIVWGIAKYDEEKK